MALVVFRPDRDGIGEILTWDSTARVLLGHAEPRAAAARSAAPVETGAYRDSIVARIVDGRTVRVAAEVAATVDYATIVESRYRTLGGAV